MSDPYTHAKSSAKRFGGTPEDYYKIHAMMDSTKGAFASNTHRAVFHHSYGSSVLIPAIFGPTITNSTGKQVSTKDIAEQHITEDFRGMFIPTLQDWLEEVPLKSWMNNAQGGCVPPSARKIYEDRQKSIAKDEIKELEENLKPAVQPDRIQKPSRGDLGLID